MSSTTQLPISSELLSFWNSEAKSGKTRTIRVVIKNEECVMAEHFDKGEESVGHDFNTLMALVNPSEPSYILFRKSDTSSTENWLFITFIPDKSKVSDKLVYAASILHLKKSLGVDFFTSENLNYAVLSDFSWASYTAAGPSREECLNEREKHFQELDKMEAQARIEQEEDARAKAQAAVRPLPKPTPSSDVKRAPVTSSAAPIQRGNPSVQRNAFSGAPRPMPVRGGGTVGNLARAFESGEANGANSSYAVSGVSGGPSLSGECGMRTDCIGGYHTVRLPFKSEASNALDELAAGSVNVVSLKIEEEHVCLEKAERATAGQVASYLSEVEPRFVLFKDGPGAVFIYCCPDKSRPRIRIVYSTSKPSIVEEATKHGISVTKKLEIRGKEEAGADVISRPSYARGSPYSAASGYSRPVNASTKAAVSTPHPVYSQINPNGNRSSGGMKKIVMPPPGAYN